MKKLLFAFSMLLPFTFSFAQTSGKVEESLVFKSALMKDGVKYSIYLPPDYGTSDRRYPVLYLLHGYTDDDTGWVQFGEAPYIADKAISNGEATPMIIVMPDGGLTWYVNDYRGKKPWADMFVKEFIPFIDATYRTRPKKEFRAIAGLSMGGYGALQTAMRNPDLFAACVAFSAGVMTDEQLVAMSDDQYKNWFGHLFGEGLKGEARITEQWSAFSPMHLLDSQPKDKLKSVRYYIDCGDDDFLYKGNSALHVKMRDLEIPHEYRVRDGHHSWSYWRTGLPEGLKFITESFHR